MKADVLDLWDEATGCLKRKDYQEAIQLFEHLYYKENMAISAVELARIYEFGNSNCFKRDFLKALKWYEIAQRTTDPETGAMGIARIYFYGKGVEKDKKKALQLYANIKHPNAYFMVGYAYQHGVAEYSRDLNKALYFYHLAVEGGHILAVRNVSVVYLMKFKLGKAAAYWVRFVKTIASDLKTFQADMNYVAG